MVRFLMPVPAAFMTKMSAPFLLYLVKAIFVPSGETASDSSNARLSVSLVDPGAPIVLVKMSAPSLVYLAKAILRPSADHDGEKAFWGPSLSWAPPSGATAKMPEVSCL